MKIKHELGIDLKGLIEYLYELSSKSIDDIKKEDIESILMNWEELRREKMEKDQLNIGKEALISENRLGKNSKVAASLEKGAANAPSSEKGAARSEKVALPYEKVASSYEKVALPYGGVALPYEKSAVHGEGGLNNIGRIYSGKNERSTEEKFFEKKKENPLPEFAHYKNEPLGRRAEKMSHENPREFGKAGPVLVSSIEYNRAAEDPDQLYLDITQEAERNRSLRSEKFKAQLLSQIAESQLEVQRSLEELRKENELKYYKNKLKEDGMMPRAVRREEGDSEQVKASGSKYIPVPTTNEGAFPGRNAEEEREQLRKKETKVEKGSSSQNSDSQNISKKPSEVDAGINQRKSKNSNLPRKMEGAQDALTQPRANSTDKGSNMPRNVVHKVQKYEIHYQTYQLPDFIPALTNSTKDPSFSGSSKGVKDEPFVSTPPKFSSRVNLSSIYDNDLRSLIQQNEEQESMEGGGNKKLPSGPGSEPEFLLREESLEAFESEQTLERKTKASIAENRGSTEVNSMPQEKLLFEADLASYHEIKGESEKPQENTSEIADGLFRSFQSTPSIFDPLTSTRSIAHSVLTENMAEDFAKKDAKPAQSFEQNKSMITDSLAVVYEKVVNLSSDAQLSTIVEKEVKKELGNVYDSILSSVEKRGAFQKEEFKNNEEEMHKEEIYRTSFSSEETGRSDNITERREKEKKKIPGLDESVESALRKALAGKEEEEEKEKEVEFLQGRNFDEPLGNEGDPRDRMRPLELSPKQKSVEHDSRPAAHDEKFVSDWQDKTNAIVGETKAAGKNEAEALESGKAKADVAKETERTSDMTFDSPVKENRASRPSFLEYHRDSLKRSIDKKVEADNSENKFMFISDRNIFEAEKKDESFNTPIKQESNLPLPQSERGSLGFNKFRESILKEKEDTSPLSSGSNGQSSSIKKGRNSYGKKVSFSEDLTPTKVNPKKAEGGTVAAVPKEPEAVTFEAKPPLGKRLSFADYYNKKTSTKENSGEE